MKCNACDQPASWTASVERYVTREGRRIMHDPARFILCCFHKNTLESNDPAATFRKIPETTEHCTGTHFLDYEEDPE